MLEQLLTFTGGAIVFYWLWAMSKGRNRPYIVQGASGVILLLVGLALLVLGWRL